MSDVSNWKKTEISNQDGLSFAIFRNQLKTEKKDSEITFNIRKGDSVYYRSNLLKTFSITIHGKEEIYTKSLPNTSQWVALRFDQKDLPADFSITIKSDLPQAEEWIDLAFQNHPKLQQ